MRRIAGGVLLARVKKKVGEDETLVVCGYLPCSAVIGGAHLAKKF